MAEISLPTVDELLVLRQSRSEFRRFCSALRREGDDRVSTMLAIIPASQPVLKLEIGLRCLLSRSRLEDVFREVVRESDASGMMEVVGQMKSRLGLGRTIDIVSELPRENPDAFQIAMYWLRRLVRDAGDEDLKRYEVLVGIARDMRGG